ncbi:hypothetical protein [Inmirania thermothiophila]|uniref:Uncharacterized protein n=1 Tax=Inmirania thermothiophila TaxID=1750597 RepID=A0A3N1Y6S7_9GAMM|nr:hypothetical protein [Inmirania thermothiophila]ROR34231.1 hypothetical protein EDC57_0127 [Inmirania thermothiophila]
MTTMRHPMTVRALQLAAGLALAAWMGAGAWAAETLTGRINGLDCTTRGIQCPVDRLDPHVAVEPDFVLVVGDRWFFMPNVDRSTKVRHVLERVQVVGERHPRYNSIQVEEIRVERDGRWHKIWSQEDVERERAAIYDRSS